MEAIQDQFAYLSSFARKGYPHLWQWFREDVEQEIRLILFRYGSFGESALCKTFKRRMRTMERDYGWHGMNGALRRDVLFSAMPCGLPNRPMPTERRCGKESKVSAVRLYLMRQRGQAVDGIARTAGIKRRTVYHHLRVLHQAALRERA
jgi:hypothetical protein